MSEESEKVGIVVIGRNEGERLSRCLASLQGQSGLVVYVDSASTDLSVQVGLSFGAQVVRLKPDLPLTAARARAEGFSALDSACPGLDYVFFVDGDCEVEPTFIADAVDYLSRHPHVAVACGRRRERYPGASPFNALIDREWATPVGDALACGGDALYRADAYRGSGGFNSTMLAGEEPELCHRLRTAGWRIVRLDLPMTVHDAALHQLGQWWRRAIRSGMGYAQAWMTTRKGGGPALYGREIVRALFWAAALPATAMILSFATHPLMLLLWPSMVGLQFIRITLRDGVLAAALSILGKFAELWGILIYGQRALRGASGHTVNYK